MNLLGPSSTHAEALLSKMCSRSGASPDSRHGHGQKVHGLAEAQLLGAVHEHGAADAVVPAAWRLNGGCIGLRCRAAAGARTLLIITLFACLVEMSAATTFWYTRVFVTAPKDLRAILWRWATTMISRGLG